MRYSADMTAGALKVPESRAVAGLLLEGSSDEQWRQAIYQDNILRTRSPKSAQRLRGLLRKRLESMEPELWQLVRDGSNDVATHACFAAAVKHSPLLGDFLDLVVRDEYRTFSTSLSNRLWSEYIESCRGRDPEMPRWSEETIERLRSSVFQSLAQAGYIADTRSLTLQTVHFAAPVLQYLEEHDEKYVLRCIQIAP